MKYKIIKNSKTTIINVNLDVSSMVEDAMNRSRRNSTVPARRERSPFISKVNVFKAFRKAYTKHESNINNASQYI